MDNAIAAATGTLTRRLRIRAVPRLRGMNPGVAAVSQAVSQAVSPARARVQGLRNRAPQRSSMRAVQGFGPPDAQKETPEIVLPEMVPK